MKTKDGILILGKKEQQALHTVVAHVQKDMRYGGRGTFTSGKTDSEGNWLYDNNEGKKAELGIQVIEFILKSLTK